MSRRRYYVRSRSISKKFTNSIFSVVSAPGHQWARPSCILIHLSSSAPSQWRFYKSPSPARICKEKPVRHPQNSDHQALDSFLPSMACINTFQSCSIARGAKINTRTKSSGGRGSPTFQCRASTFVDGSLRLELDENPEAIISGEWPENFSLLSYDDLRAYLESQKTVEVGDQHVAFLREAMSTPVLMATVEQTLEEVECHFEAVSGLPVVDSNFRCVGVIVKKDRMRASHGSKTKVAEVMTTPAITLSSDRTVMDAAALMLKKKIHRLPIVNQDNQVIGIVTRADVLRELEGLLKV